MKIRELFNDKSKWTKCYTAKNAEGQGTDPTGSRAVCWCLVGAIYRCYGFYDDACDPINKIVNEVFSMGYSSISQYNDLPDRTFEEVKALVDKLDV